MIGKSLRKIIKQLLLIFCTLKKKTYFRLISQNITQPVKKININKTNNLLIIPNKEKKWWNYLVVKTLSALYRKSS